MDWKYVSLAFFIVGILCLPVWPYSAGWRLYPTIFCWFITVLTLLVSVFAKHGSVVWRGKGKG
jgi:hypothetical protein